jgi:hypothetical protein
VESNIEGGCLCGAVRYRARVAPHWSMVCHCRTCRRACGAPVVAWVTFAQAQFAFNRGVPARHASSEPVTRTFCAACGTALTYAHADDAANIDVTTCSLDQAEAFPPTHHSWTGHDLTWVRFGDGLPAYPGSRSGISG